MNGSLMRCSSSSVRWERAGHRRVDAANRGCVRDARMVGASARTLGAHGGLIDAQATTVYTCSRAIGADAGMQFRVARVVRRRRRTVRRMRSTGRRALRNCVPGGRECSARGNFLWESPTDGSDGGKYLCGDGNPLNAASRFCSGKTPRNYRRERRNAWRAGGNRMCVPAHESARALGESALGARVFARKDLKAPRNPPRLRAPRSNVCAASGTELPGSHAARAVATGLRRTQCSVGSSGMLRETARRLNQGTLGTDH